MLNAVEHRWQGPGGCAQVLRIALPLILSTSAHSLQMFIDRTFLMWYSRDAMSGAMFAGIASFAISSLFFGIATYVNTFVAQYSGAKRYDRVGPALWQGIYFSILAGALLMLLAAVSRQLFARSGHDPAVRTHETAYFQIMCLGSIPMLLSATLSCFYTGRGKTWIVMFIAFIGTAVNIILDYLMIFGKLGFPAWGVAGAAWATVLSNVVTTVIYIALFLRAKYRTAFNTLHGYPFDGALFARLMRFGAPNGIQFMLDVSAFTFFLAVVGRMDPLGLAATSIAFQINTLAFMPMIGMGIAVSTLVGQALGSYNPALAQRSTWSACLISFTYMSLIALGYILLPDVFLYPSAVKADPVEFEAIRPIAVKLLYFVAFYSLFDTGNIVFAAALKGAGDTRFVMIFSVILSWLLMALPSALALKLGWSLYVCWLFVTAYVCLLALIFLLRFLTGKWKSMRVIESAPAAIPPTTPELPTLESDLA